MVPTAVCFSAWYFQTVGYNKEGMHCLFTEELYNGALYNLVLLSDVERGKVISSFKHKFCAHC